MKRTRAYLLAFLMAVCSCVNPLMEPDPEIDGSTYPEGAKVTITFNVAGEGITPTKAQALGEDQELTSLHLAVFGSSGYLKEYVEATPLGPTGELYSFTGPKDNPEEPDITEEVPVYAFSATLTLTDSKRIIHFIGNGPETLSFGYADAVLSPLLSFSGERAYWQMLRVDGIHAKQDEYGNYIDQNGDVITDGTGYVVADATQQKFATVPLVRNWAKIIVETDTNGGNDPCFELISYAVVHVPDRGTLAPHSSATNGFVENYQDSTYLKLVNCGYPANLPPNTQIDETIPDIADFKYWDPDETVHGDPETELVGSGWRNGVAPAHRKGAVYLYERPVPSDQLPPTFLIIYGIYKPSDVSDPYYGQDRKCFYKVDLMTDRKYYPIYRNFQYRVLIHSILSLGHATPEAAAAAAGSADVSADINARHLPDISDGHRRLAIQPWMAKTFTADQVDNNELSVYFDNDITVDGWDTTPGSVTLELLPMKNSSIDPVILSYSIDNDPDHWENGFRKITFTTSGPSDNIRSQTLRVTGSSGDESLYRDVVITIQNIQDMRVSCSDRRINPQKGTPVDVYIDIPDGLAESMFPLDFLIEPEKMTLSPNNDNLPVEYGASISGNGKRSFHFIKSLDWDEYRSLPAVLDESDKLWRRMTCHFISNRDASATSIYVTNEDFFHDAATAFSNFADRTFYDMRIEEPIRRNAPGQNLTLAFSVARGDNNELPEVVLTVDGLIPQAREGLSLPADFVQVSDVAYRFTPTASDVRIPFVTSDADGEVYCRLEAVGYEPQSTETHHFTLFHGIGFFDAHATKQFSNGWSNVVLGRINMTKDKFVLFGYFDDPKALNPEITLENLDGLTKQHPSAYPWAPDGPVSNGGDANYHELDFKATHTSLYHEISFTLSASGYLQEPVHAYRFDGLIGSYPSGSNTIPSLKTDNVKGTPLTHTVTMDGNKHTSTATFSSEFHVDNSGVWLDAGEEGTITFTNSKPNEYKYFYLQLNIGTNKSYNDGKRLFPLIEETTSVPYGTFEIYPGNNEHCIWMLPQDAALTSTVELHLKAHDDYPTLITGIVFKTFKGTLQ